MEGDSFINKYFCLHVVSSMGSFENLWHPHGPYRLLIISPMTEMHLEKENVLIGFDPLASGRGD